MRLPWRYWLHRARSFLAQHGIWYERQTCPRRMSEPGPWKFSGGLDFWERGRWGWRPLRLLNYWLHNGPVGNVARRISDWGWDVARRRDFDRIGMLARWTAELFNWYSGGDHWEWPWQPRTCSFCGGAHPDDILRLMREGWEVGNTDKSYKRYLEPKAIGTRRIELGRGCRGHDIPVRPWHAVPPVKVYVQHFSEMQVKRFNLILGARYGKAA